MPTTLSWDAAGLDAGSDDGVVHETTANTAYSDASEIRKGDPTGAPLYAAALEAWYPLQEPSGATTAYDFSGNGYDGTHQGATPAGGTPITGLRTTSFDGVNDYIDLGRDFDFSSSFSVAVWARVPNGDDSFASIIDPFDGSRDAFRLYKQESSTGNDVVFEIFTGDRAEGLDVTDGKWRHYVGVYDEGLGEIRLYYDGQQEGSSTNAPDNASNLPDNSSDYAIGRRQDDTFYWKGDIADVRIYDRLLSDSEIQTLYEVLGAPSKHTSISKST
jgi:hypothetical protein